MFSTAEEQIGFGNRIRRNKADANQLLYENILGHSGGKIERLFELPGDACASTDIFKKLFSGTNDEKYSHIYVTDRDPRVFGIIKESRPYLKMTPEPMLDSEALFYFKSHYGQFDVVVLDYCGFFCEATEKTFEDIFRFDIVRPFGLVYFGLNNNHYQPSRVLKAFDYMTKLGSSLAGKTNDTVKAACYNFIAMGFRYLYACKPIFHHSYRDTKATMQFHGFKIHKCENYRELHRSLRINLELLDGELLEEG
jgi:hypothetical protein